MQLRVKSAREIALPKQSGMWDTMKGWFGGGQEQPQQAGNLQEIGQQLSQAWRSFATLYNSQKDIINPAYQHLSGVLKSLANPETAKYVQLTPGTMNQLNSLIQTLNQAVAEENQDTQFLKDIALQIQGVAEYFGMGAQQQGKQQTQQTEQPAATDEAAAAAANTDPAAVAAAAPTEEAAAANAGAGTETAAPAFTQPRRTNRARNQQAETQEMWAQRMRQKFPNATDEQLQTYYNQWKDKRRAKGMLMPAAASARAFVKVAS